MLVNWLYVRSCSVSAERWRGLKPYISGRQIAGEDSVRKQGACKGARVREAHGERAHEESACEDRRPHQANHDVQQRRPLLRLNLIELRRLDRCEVYQEAYEAQDTRCDARTPTLRGRTHSRSGCVSLTAAEPM